ncbi:SNF1-related protein kinase catalytic subunit alpha KIN11 isoform X1 [Physcomitrium patens]|uniref:non-specific serine/threonine protein kinase n=1 Tax=Physcomitrium patens TaxID=3218 RepID=A0A7I4DGQ5_PHYPA|nr:SNF1-related protein kinase catalytic subunit alpha KIN11-like isoform X1 [Physcomitrium patens]XP_024370888.1 SNF1-related protein kinase catalytic subunit alpha KIN11-like isoform X1 [Physcomitrium patens]|eukprot:XP_024370886.1 SNF1-related protein kinase catalytic subunit alpha KIN11-like isoform X1 [Physcomitrella patens]
MTGGESSSTGHVLRRQSSATVCAEFNYRLGKTMGFGAFSKVKSATHVLTGQKVAIKIINKEKMKDMEDKVRRELKIMQMVTHPHIVRLYEIIETRSDIYVVMEYVESGDLFDFIVLHGRLHEDDARHFFQQIIAGVEYCHKNKVVHRDLKPENLLLHAKRRSVKIADFGLSNIMRDGHFLRTSCGSPNYAAPEVIQRKYYAGPEVDVWSCGVILYAMLCGILPFDDENITSLYQKITDGIYTLPSHLSSQARDLITKILNTDPLTRITIPEIRCHPWFQLHLPRYLALGTPHYIQNLKFIDEDVSSLVEKIGFDKKWLVDCLQRQEQTKATVTYYLILDSQRSHNPDDYLETEYEDLDESGEGSESASKSDASTIVEPAQDVVHLSSSLMTPIAAYAARPLISVLQNGSWAVGLQSQAHPSEIMMEILKTLQDLDINWKTVAPYCIRCRWVSHISSLMVNKSHGSSVSTSLSESPMTLGSLPTSEISPVTDSSPLEDAELEEHFVVKFQLQLYKTRERKYLLDIQRIDGPTFLFMDLCTAFLAEIGAV